MTIADDMSALSERILLIVFCDNSCTDQLASPSTGISSGMPFAFQRVRIRVTSYALSTLLSTLLHLATVGLRHSGYFIPMFAYILGKIIAMTRN